jgi:hypothetical protein
LPAKRGIRSLRQSSTLPLTILRKRGRSALPSWVAVRLIDTTQQPCAKFLKKQQEKYTNTQGTSRIRHQQKKKKRSLRDTDKWIESGGIEENPDCKKRISVGCGNNYNQDIFHDQQNSSSTFYNTLIRSVLLFGSEVFCLPKRRRTNSPLRGRCSEQYVEQIQ